jgi:hypothetical protein
MNSLYKLLQMTLTGRGFESVRETGADDATVEMDKRALAIEIAGAGVTIECDCPARRAALDANSKRTIMPNVRLPSVRSAVD